MALFAGVDLGGTHLKLVVTDKEGHVKLQRQVDMPFERNVGQVADLMSQLIADCRNEAVHPIVSIGLTMPCVLDPNNGSVQLIPNFPQEWIGIQFGLLLQERCNMPVYTLNDARAATYAELRLGAGREYQDFVVMILGTGVGGGIVLGGELWTGIRGVSGEIGHMTVVSNGLRCGCGNRGCLETIASGPAITAEAVRRVLQGLPTLMRDLVGGDVSKITPTVVDEAAVVGDEAALEILHHAAMAIKQALLSIRALINPEALILGGGVGRSLALFRMLKDECVFENILFPGRLGSVEVEKAMLSQWAGAIGAAVWASDKQFRISNRIEE
jgi:glucokinase